MNPQIGDIFVDYEDDVYVLMEKFRYGKGWCWNYIVCIKKTLRVSIWSIPEEGLRNWYRTDGTTYIRYVASA